MGLVLFTDRIEKFIPPKKGRRHVLRVIRELLFFKPAHKGTDIAGALRFLSKVAKRRCVVFLVSDFLSKNYERALRIANRRHDMIALTLTDRRETSLPSLGLMEFEDAETGEAFLLDTRFPDVRRQFERLTSQALAERNRFFRSIDIDCIQIQTDRPTVEPLIQFFRTREKRH